MRFQIARSAGRTGRLLQSLVAAELGGASHSGVVCYGVGYSGSAPALNARCSAMNKLQQAHALREALGESALLPLDFTDALAMVDVDKEFEDQPGGSFHYLRPVLGRKVRHAKGKDIRMCLEPWQVESLRGISDFFTPYTPSKEEYRVWVYRKRHLGTYRKELIEPGLMRRVGRNYDNGFRFMKVDREVVPEELKEVGRKAIAALDLDFGAVDVIQTPDGRYVVLEVNTAPGVADGRRAVIQRLAHRIARWAQEGYPNAASQALSAD